MSYRILHIPTGTYLYKEFGDFWKIAEFQSPEDAYSHLKHTIIDWECGELYFEEEIKLFDLNYGDMIFQLEKIYTVSYIENEFEIISV